MGLSEVASENQEMCRLVDVVHLIEKAADKICHQDEVECLCVVMGSPWSKERQNREDVTSAKRQNLAARLRDVARALPDVWVTHS
jgi:hypothetical protein